MVLFGEVDREVNTLINGCSLTISMIFNVLSVLLLLLLFLIFQDRVSLYSLRTHFIELAELKPTELPLLPKC